METKHIKVYYSCLEWEAPDESGLKRWRLIIEHGKDNLEWVYTYNPKLTEHTYHFVEFYRDTSMRRCVRIPKKGDTNE